MNKKILAEIQADNGLNAVILEDLLKGQGLEEQVCAQIVNKVYSPENHPPISKKELFQLNDTIRENDGDGLNKDKGWLDVITDGLSYLAFIGLFSLFTWLIVNEQSRATIEFGIQPGFVILIAVAIIFFIALLEGSQIAIIDIADKDLANVADRYPIASQIQKLIRTKEGIEDYLIGRQLLVVALVIIFSLMTSFPNIKGVIHTVSIPSFIDFIAFKLGLLNALIMLWLGQLIPQLLASKAPQTILNSRLMKWVVRLCLFISRLKIAKPSSFFVSLARVSESKPAMSAFENFLKYKDTYRHHVDSYDIKIYFDENMNPSLEALQKLSFSGYVKHITSKSIAIYGNILKYRFDQEHSAINKDSVDIQIADADWGSEPINNGEMKYFSHLLEPAKRDFIADDKLVVAEYFELDETEQIDCRINKPTRILSIQCNFPRKLIEKSGGKQPELIIEHSTFDEASEAFVVDHCYQLTVKEQGEFFTASFAQQHPTLKSSYTIRWAFQ
ncbi:silicon transporter [Sinobacterium caligoides]|uniref:Silicon transporter n=1 Tax=Sinobacterium caligoides TaxID=933926 RepID=A0A3N2DY73_9GAMM|nr:hypothetical protein [Sinobacterium caligoides]ROS04622.1 silicon transporter [Sinobacterium caligoides]